MTNAQANYRPFLNIFVVWHPKFGEKGQDGRALAEMLYRDFCRNPEKPMSPAVGVPVYFRTSAGAGIAPPSINLDDAFHTIVVILGTASMVLDSEYQRYAQDLAGKAPPNGPHRILLFNFTGVGRIQLGNTQGVLLPAGDAELKSKLRLTFAAEACRLLQNRARGGDSHQRLSLEPPRLFISHAKRDAKEKAEEIKKLVEETPVDTFFDRVDIAAGYDFTDEIKESIKRSAILAWQSDEYASRPWCNIELLTAKESLRPIVVVLGVKAGEERSFPYLGNVRTIVATGDNSSEIIIAAVREFLRMLYANGRFRTLAEAGFIPNTRFCLFRPPEPIDAVLLEKKTQDHATSGAEDSSATESTQEQVLYPDPPLSTVESEVLARLFPHIRFVTPTTVEASLIKGRKIALSISESDDLADFGHSPLHLQSTMIEVARHLLSRGAVIAYGGDLREKEKYGFTRQLLDLIYTYKDLGRPPLEPIWNFLAHHIAAELPDEEESRLLELARFEKPLPKNLEEYFSLKQGEKKKIPDDTAESRYLRARFLTAMREAVVERTDARIVLGGRVSGHQGKYPGILEEAYLTLCAQKPLYLIGAFGGCTRLLVSALRDKQRPEALTRDYQARHPRNAKYTDASGREISEQVPFEQLEELYRKYETDSRIGQGPIDYEGCVNSFLQANIADLRNGLSEAETLELFATPDLDRIISLLLKGLGKAFEPHGSR